MPFPYGWVAPVSVYLSERGGAEVDGSLPPPASGRHRRYGVRSVSNGKGWGRPV